MNPIINPSLIYIIDTLGQVKGTLGFLIIIFPIFMMICFMVEVNWLCYYVEENCKKVISTYTLLVVMSILIPSRNTLYKILIFKHSTPQNIELVIDKINEVIGKINK